MIENKKQRNTVITVTIGAGIVAIIAAFWIWLTPWVWYDNSPKPLGNQLEYIGKKDYGCGVGFCDSKPGATYYYATDMSKEELGVYFKKATTDSPKREFLDAEGETYSIGFSLKDSRSGFTLYYYEDGPANSKSIFSNISSKKHLTSLDFKVYQVARDSL